MSKPKTTTVSFEVTLPPDGWEVSNRRPKIGEHAMAYRPELKAWTTPCFAKDAAGGWADVNCQHFIFAYPKIDKWNQQLEALKLADGYVGVDENGGVWWVDKKPKALKEYWYAKDGQHIDFKDPLLMLGLPIPQYEGDWKKSLRQIKNHKVVL
jgi:hypothetical protein